ncbi:MAG: hypothetical protein DCC58_01875 [Chloroflexi bacterium]|nr:MAG: hypothetical protein DCC58_01875 [Chloroflexota bacterium]
MSKVIFSGENPGLTLYRPGTDEVVASASYWRCVYSEHGEGNALIFWSETDGAGGPGIKGIYSDNAGVARLVTDRFTQHFGNYQNRGFDAIEPTHARFFQDSDSRWYHRVVCNTGASVIELVWSGVLDYQMVNRSDYALGPSRWDLATVICPCRSGHIFISSGTPLAGDVRVNESGERPSSSAFLAFSETWVERE